MARPTAFFSLFFLLIPLQALALEDPPVCIAEWTTQGEGMDAISGLDGNVFVTDRTYNSVIRYSAQGEVTEEWLGFVNPRGIATDSLGFVYVCNNNSGEVTKYDPDGTLVTSWLTSKPMYIAIDANDDVWITNNIDHKVSKFDSSGSLLTEWPTGDYPRGIAVDSEGHVYVGEQGINRVSKYDGNGNWLYHVGTTYGWDVAVDRQDNVYLAETNRITKYSKYGELLAEWYGCEVGANSFRMLSGIGVGEDGVLATTDFVGRHVALFALATPVSCSGFEPPMDSYPVRARKNRAFPLKMQLFNTDGFEMTDADVTAAPLVEVMFTAVGGDEAVDVTDALLSVGLGTEGNQFVYIAEDNMWKFNLKSTNYTGAGTYVVTAISGAPDEYVLDPSCVTSFEVR